ncbi:hypothetical protein L1D52_19455 [Vibrio brasiliensis]|uniref:hypothetical protein n=1 Tax=Vibrio brasiliensis TaxID=170652 RepID=UPI001EFECF7F|nr:hypothetical protein [Vibrio brasiliensis]MCG9784536.1 hypothetical protein [Vibrio brasiliensis]
MLLTCQFNPFSCLGKKKSGLDALPVAVSRDGDCYQLLCRYLVGALGGLALQYFALSTLAIPEQERLTCCQNVHFRVQI